MGVRTSGILGAEVLRHFVVTMDLKARKLHLEPAQKAAAESLEPGAPEGEPQTQPERSGDSAAEPPPAN
jgi:hypothetical protein